MWNFWIHHRNLKEKKNRLKRGLQSYSDSLLVLVVNLTFTFHSPWPRSRTCHRRARVPALDASNICIYNSHTHTHTHASQVSRESSFKRLALRGKECFFGTRCFVVCMRLIRNHIWLSWETKCGIIHLRISKGFFWWQTVP